MDKTTSAVVGVVCLTAIEITALLTGTDGKFLSIVVGVIASVISGAVGYSKGKGSNDK